MGYAADITGAASAALGIIAIVLVAYLLTVVLAIVMYILQALGIYTIAQRRGIKHPWMAWLPMTNMWILGSIADQYRYVSQGQVRNRRKVLLGLNIAMLALGLVFFCAYVGMFVDLLMQAPVLEYMGQREIANAVITPLLWILGTCLALWIVAVVAVVFQYICLYDLYASCNPDNKVLCLVLSILVNVTMPFFVFACRKKDGGMPPRKDEVPAALPAEPVKTAEE